MNQHKDYIHARLSLEDHSLVSALKKMTGESESSLVKKGLQALYKTFQHKLNASSALSLAQASIGRFSGKTVTDLSVNPKHLKGYGK